MNNPHAEGVPWTSAVAAMSQRSENKAFSGWNTQRCLGPHEIRAFDLRTELAQHRNTACRLQCVPQPLLRHSPRSWRGDYLLPGFCSPFCMRWELRGDSMKARWCFGSQARNQANALTWANETREYWSNIERGLFHPHLLTFPVHFNQMIMCNSRCYFANSKAGLILQGAEGFPRSAGCQQPSPAKCGWWDPQRHLTPSWTWLLTQARLRAEQEGHFPSQSELFLLFLSHSNGEEKSKAQTLSSFNKNQSRLSETINRAKSPFISVFPIWNVPNYKIKIYIQNHVTPSTLPDLCQFILEALKWGIWSFQGFIFTNSEFAIIGLFPRDISVSQHFLTNIFPFSSNTLNRLQWKKSKLWKVVENFMCYLHTAPFLSIDPCTGLQYFSFWHISSCSTYSKKHELPYQH